MKKTAKVRCGWCKAPVEQPARGRPRLYCDAACRQRAYEERRVLRERGPQLTKLAKREQEKGRERARELRRQLDAFNAAIEAYEVGGLDHALRRRRGLFGR